MGLKCAPYAAPVPDTKKPISLYASLEQVGPPRASSRIKSQLARLRHWDLDIHTPTKEELVRCTAELTVSDLGFWVLGVGCRVRIWRTSLSEPGQKAGGKRRPCAL